MRLDGTCLWAIGVWEDGLQIRVTLLWGLTDKRAITVFKGSHTNFVRVLSLEILMLETVHRFKRGILPYDSAGKFTIFTPLQYRDSMAMRGVANYVPSAILYLRNY